MGTLPAWWTEPYPEVSSPKTAADYLDALGAALSRRQENGGWVLSTGEQELISTDTEEELDSFVLGFALAHLIVERHGLIGQRTGPTRLPHPAEMEAEGEGLETGADMEGEDEVLAEAAAAAEPVAGDRRDAEDAAVAGERDQEG